MHFKWIAPCVLAAALYGAGAAQAASMDYFLKVDDIKGDSVDERYRDWIDIQSFSWGVTNSTGGSQGGGGGAGKPVFQDFSWSQIVDSSIPPMFVALTQGKRIKEITLEVVRPGGAKSSGPFFQMSFEDAVLSSLTVVGTGEEPIATLSFSYSKVELVYTPQDPKGGNGKESSGSWDLNEKLEPEFSGDPMVVLGLFESGGNVNLAAVTGVPEPGTWAMLALGLATLGAAARRRAR